MSGGLALTLFLGTPVGAQAHAELVESSPAEDSTVQGTPDEIVLVFTEALETDGTSITLHDDGGDEVTEGDLDPEDDTRLVITDIPDLAPGEYEVRAAAATDDGHIERFRVPFTVEAATPAPTVTPAPTPAATDAASDAPSPSPSVVAPSPAASETPADPASSTSDILIPIVVLLALVGIGATYFLRRRRPAA